MGNRKQEREKKEAEKEKQDRLINAKECETILWEIHKRECFKPPDNCDCHLARSLKWLDSYITLRMVEICGGPKPDKPNSKRMSLTLPYNENKARSEGQRHGMRHTDS